MIMKQILLKTGILLFCYTLIISNHIEKSKYFMIEDFSKVSSEYYLIDEGRIGIFTVPTKKYIPKEKYLNYLSTYPSGVRNLVVSNISEKIFPFDNRSNLWFTIFFLLSVTIIIVSIDTLYTYNLNKKVLILSIPLLFYFFQSLNMSNQMPLIRNNPDTESDISIIKSDIDDLKSNQSDLEGRVSDLEY